MEPSDSRKDSISEIKVDSGPDKKEEEQFDVEWDLKAWLNFVQDILVYLNSTEQEPDHRIYQTERHILRKNFGESRGFFCYIFKGAFFPSADKDGIFWKPSQSAKPATIGSPIIKRYFYHTSKTGLKINRQVSWLNGTSDYYLIEYRSGYLGGDRISMAEIESPPGFSWPAVVRTVIQYCKDKQLTPSFSLVIDGSRRSLLMKDGNESDGNLVEDGRGIKHKRNEEHKVEEREPKASKRKTTKHSYHLDHRLFSLEGMIDGFEVTEIGVGYSLSNMDNDFDPFEYDYRRSLGLERVNHIEKDPFNNSAWEWVMYPNQ